MDVVAAGAFGSSILSRLPGQEQRITLLPSVEISNLVISLLQKLGRFSVFWHTLKRLRVNPQSGRSLQAWKASSQGRPIVCPCGDLRIVSLTERKQTTTSKSPDGKLILNEICFRAATAIVLICLLTALLQRRKLPLLSPSSSQEIRRDVLTC